MKFCKSGLHLYAGERCKQCQSLCKKAWKLRNPEKVKSGNAAYSEKNKEKIRKKQAERYAANPDKEKERSLQWRLANKEKIKIKSIAYRLIHKDKLDAVSAAWQRDNPEKVKIHAQNRRARLRNAGGSLSIGLSEKLFKLQNGKCPCCKKPLGEDYHLDHIMPIALGGTNTDDNIQLLRKQCNHQKHAKHPVDFMQERGLLI